MLGTSIASILWHICHLYCHPYCQLSTCTDLTGKGINHSTTIFAHHGNTSPWYWYQFWTGCWRETRMACIKQQNLTVEQVSDTTPACIAAVCKYFLVWNVGLYATVCTSYSTMYDIVVSLPCCKSADVSSWPLHHIWRMFWCFQEWHINISQSVYPHSHLSLIDPPDSCHWSPPHFPTSTLHSIRLNCAGECSSMHCCQQESSDLVASTANWHTVKIHSGTFLTAYAGRAWALLMLLMVRIGPFLLL